MKAREALSPRKNIISEKQDGTRETDKRAKTRKKHVTVLTSTSPTAFSKIRVDMRKVHNKL